VKYSKAAFAIVKGVLDFKLANYVNLEIQYFFPKNKRINDITE
jgi:hypothetical protein